MTTYRYCFKCGLEWNGYGVICNQCKQIEAINQQAERSRQQVEDAARDARYNSKYQETYTYNRTATPHTPVVYDSASVGIDTIVGAAILVWICSIGHWAIPKFFLKLMGGALYMMFGLWFGADPSAFGL